MKNSIIGYIVVSDTEGEPLEFCTHPEYPDKILLRGDIDSMIDQQKLRTTGIHQEKIVKIQMQLQKALEVLEIKRLVLKYEHRIGIK